MFCLGYNSNGFAHHQLEDICAILADIGYRSIALTVERSLLDRPDAESVGLAVKKIAALLARHSLRCTIETGSRFYLDPRRKQQPTLISAERQERKQRLAFLTSCIDLAAALDAESVSLWSGSPADNADQEGLYDRLLECLRSLLSHARSRGVRVSFEPEPGMLIDTMDKFERLDDDLGDSLFGLTLDVGHVHCLDDGDSAEHILKWRGKLWNVHIEDMRRGVHEHLPFGAGEMQFASIFAALREIAYRGPIHVELSRHSHNAVEMAKKSFAFLIKF